MAEEEEKVVTWEDNLDRQKAHTSLTHTESCGTLALGRRSCHSPVAGPLLVVVGKHVGYVGVRGAVDVERTRGR